MTGIRNKRTQTPFLASAALLLSLPFTSGAIGQTLTGTGPDGNELTGLGDLAGGADSSVATGISGDGSVVVGVSPSASGSEAFRWTQSGGLVGLGDLAGGGFSSVAVDANTDGSVVVGYGDSGGREAFRWTQGTGLVNIGDLAGGATFAEAWGVSADGSVVVGRGNSASGPEAFRWTQGTGMVGLGDLAGGAFSSEALGISDDGLVIVGSGQSASGREAFRWTQGTGLVGLGDLAGGAFTSFAYAANSDGSVIVGYGTSGSGTEAFRWTQSGGMAGLGDLPGGAFESLAFDVNSDGSVVVGRSVTASTTEAFRWWSGSGAGAGMQRVADLLMDDGVDLGTWVLTSARGVSDDGTVIVGFGTNPSGDMEAWLARVNTGLVIAPSAMISINDFSSTLTEAAGTSSATEDGLQTSTNNLINIGRHLGMSPKGTGGGPQRTAWSNLQYASTSDEISLPRERNWSVWGLGGAYTQDRSNGDQDDVIGSLGLASRLTPDTRFGLGVNIGESELQLNDTGSESDQSFWGVNSFASYEPSGLPLRVYAGVVASWLDEELVRGYLNGVTPVSSRGQRDGNAFGGAVQAGWEYGVSQSLSVMPFAGYQISHIRLDGYSESGGPFPAVFNEVSETAHVGRVGAEVTNWFGGRTALWGSVAYAHQFDDDGLTSSGSVPTLGSSFSFTDRSSDRDWGELKVGVSGRLSERFSANLSVDVASDFDDEPSLGGILGFDYKI